MSIIYSVPLVSRRVFKETRASNIWKCRNFQAITGSTYLVVELGFGARPTAAGELELSTDKGFDSRDTKVELVLGIAGAD